MPHVNENPCQIVKFNQINEEQNEACSKILLRHVYAILQGWVTSNLCQVAKSIFF